MSRPTKAFLRNFRLATVAGIFFLAACGGEESATRGVVQGAPAEASETGDAEPAPAEASSPEDKAPSEDEGSSRPAIVVLGDSLTAGYGISADQAFPALLQERIDAAGLEYSIVNAGVSGDTTAGGRRRLAWVLDGQDVAVLVVALGGNDGLRGLPVAEMRANLEAIVDEAKARGIAVMLTGMEAPPNHGPRYTDAFRAVFPEIAERRELAFYPFLLTGVAGDAELNQADGIHPNPEGARRIAEELWPHLEPLLSETHD